VSEKIKRQLARLEGDVRKSIQEAHEEAHKRQELLAAIREAAERQNEHFLRRRDVEREIAWLERIGFAGQPAEDPPGDDSLFPPKSDEPPFAITESGDVRSSRDGKQITTFHQTLAEEWYWEFRDMGYNPRGLIHDEETQHYYMPDPPHELAFSRDRCYLPRYFWALGDDRADPYCISVQERLPPGGRP
jgi:hypothetical protein